MWAVGWETVVEAREVLERKSPPFTLLLGAAICFER